MLRLFLFIALIMGLMSAPARAQQPGGFPDILEDIFGGQSPLPGQGPYGGQSGITYIENIPVQVTFDSRPDLLPPEATLVLTAIAPPPANVRRAKPLVMGETRLLISRLAPPLSLVIAVPSDLAREVDYARIEAKIVDQNGNIAFALENSAEYRGGQPPFLELIPAGALNPNGQSLPARKPGTGGPMAPYIRQNIDVIKAAIELPPGAQLRRGSTLVLQVTENDLAGGFGPSVVHEQRVDIDQKQAPFHVKLNVPTGSDGTLEQPELVAYIEDWAGRKTFVRARPVKIPASRDVVMRLDPILTGNDALPNPSGNFMPGGPVIPVTGTAEFDAFKGLPRGATLSVTVRDAFNFSDIISRKDINLDGLSGYINFAFDVDAVEIKQRDPAPVLSAQIIDSAGQVLFLNRTSREVSESKNVIRLTPTSAY